MAPPEIQFLANYLTDLLVAPEHQPLVFVQFADNLAARFIPLHWHPLQPERGSGYRAISFDPSRHDGYLDPILAMLAQLIGHTTRELRRNIIRNSPESHLSGWTIWCDPGCVSIRVQASGGELRELWGTLPSHLSLPRPAYSSPSFSSISQSSPLQSPSPNKSRAIPILAPQGVAQLNVIPPTPLGSERPEAPSVAVEPEMEFNGLHSQTLVDPIQPPYKISTYCPPLEDPFLRPSSRTSCASSSSDGSDHSGFSSSSSSTATSVAPLGLLANKKMNPMAAGSINQPARGYLGFTRHYPSSSAPFLSMNSLISVAPVPSPAVPPRNQSRRAASPALSGSRRRHVASASFSSANGGRGLLVLKEGPGTVTEHSGGKVGVMGGGVLLGLPKDKESVAVVNAHARRIPNRRTRTGPANL